MNYGFFDFLTLLGALGVFLYGMKLMSESLQKVAGNKMRSILESMTSNTFRGVLTGVLITALIQSSSATTVMVVSFVNAGLMALQQSIGVIMGANIGTTVTAWMISILGFKVSISAFAYPLIGISLPFLFTQNRTHKSWAELVLGFALLFIGLGELKDAVPDLKHNPEILQSLQAYCNYGFGSYIIFMAIGTLLTMLIQSSSAAMALTLIMCYEGWIPFDVAASMVLGQNIGTTITAIMAAMVANTAAKRAAGAHVIFNVFGVVLALILFQPSMYVLEAFMLKIGYFSPFDTTGQTVEQTQKVMPIALSIYHTMFNVVNTLLLVWFAPQIARIVSKVIKSKKGQEDGYHLQHIKTGLLSTPEASIYQAQMEIQEFAKRTIKMFSQVKSLYHLDDNKQFAKLKAKITKNEEFSDELEVEIAKYLTKISETRLTSHSSRMISTMYKQIDNLESIGDSCFNLARTISRMQETNTHYAAEVNNNLNIMFGLIDDALNLMKINLESDGSIIIDNSKKKEEEINNYRDILKAEHLQNIEKGVYNYQEGIIYNDLFSECEKIGDYSINVSQAVAAGE